MGNLLKSCLAVAKFKAMGSAQVLWEPMVGGAQSGRAIEVFLEGVSLGRRGARADNGERGGAGSVLELGHSLVCPHLCQVWLEPHHRRQSIRR